MPVAAAVAVAGIGSSLIQGSAAKSAAQTQSDASSRAAEMQLGMFNTIRSDLSPYRNIGTAALPGYSTLLGLPTSGATTPFSTGGPVPGSAPAGGVPGSPDWNAYLNDPRNEDLAKYFAENQQALAGLGLGTPDAYAAWHYQNHGQGEGRELPTFAAAAPPAAVAPTLDENGVPVAPADPRQIFLENTPGYQFTKQQGMQAVTNSLAARGLGGVSGPLGKGLARFVTGLADQTYQQAVDNFGRAVGVGQSAANQTGAFGQTATSGAAGSLLGGANAQAAGTIGAANAAASGLGSAANGFLTSRVLGMYAPASAASTIPADVRGLF